MFTQILLASDGSECASKAAHVAATLAAKFASRLTIVNVFLPTPTVGPFGETFNVGVGRRSGGRVPRERPARSGPHRGRP